VSYLLDTNVCIAFLNGPDAAVRDKLLSLPRDEVHLCSVVKAELLYGARKSHRVTWNLARLAQFFRAFASLPFDDAAAEQYGVIRAQLTARGTPIGGNDTMIAAVALAASATVVTRNREEFRRVPALAVEVW
jgi:tRNA(fMet)-specific endonuclease VapC